MAQQQVCNRFRQPATGSALTHILPPFHPIYTFTQPTHIYVQQEEGGGKAENLEKKVDLVREKQWINIEGGKRRVMEGGTQAVLTEATGAGV